MGKAASTCVLLGKLPYAKILSYFVRAKDSPRVFGHPRDNGNVKLVEFYAETTVITASICMPWGTNSNAAFLARLEVLPKVLGPKESNSEVDLTKFGLELGEIKSTVLCGWRAAFEPKIWQTRAVISAIERLPNVVGTWIWFFPSWFIGWDQWSLKLMEETQLHVVGHFLMPNSKLFHLAGELNHLFRDP